MIAAFSKALAQLGDPRTRSTVWLSIGIAVVLFIALWSGVGYMLTQTTLFTDGWLNTIVDVLGGLATLVLTWFLFPVVVSAVIGLLLERVAEAVEHRYYPGLPKAPGLSLADTLISTLRFLAVMIVVNVFVLFFLLIPPVFPFVFYGANGYLLGREYFELVALRRMNATQAKKLRASHSMTVVMSGVVTAFLLTVPFVNLIAPIVATAAMVHLFESWHRRDAAPVA